VRGEAGDALVAVLEGVHPADIAESMNQLADAEALAVFSILDNTRAAGLCVCRGCVRESGPATGELGDMKPIDPVQLEIFKSLFHSIAEEMGATLKRTAFSPNIKERRDYSCALFDATGDMIAQGDHMPVHLGSMPLSVKAAIEARDIKPGDMIMLNDPYAGGTHLPDITLVSGVFQKGRLRFYVASRAHHSDVGGMSPGSMPIAEEIYQEGLRIPPVKLVSAGKINKDVWDLVLYNVRTPREREGDLSAMFAANRTGERRLMEVVAKYGWPSISRSVSEILNYSERMTRLAIRSIPPW